MMAGGLSSVLSSWQPIWSRLRLPLKAGHLRIRLRLITVLIRVLGGYPEGVCYSILLMNTLTPLIDRLVKPTVFGAVKTKGAK